MLIQSVFLSFGHKGTIIFPLHQNFRINSLSRTQIVILVVAALTMLVDVETFLLDSLVNANTSNLLNAPEEDDTCNGCPSVDAKDTEALCSEESEAATIEGTTINGEETCHQGTEDTTYTMY